MQARAKRRRLCTWKKRLAGTNPALAEAVKNIKTAAAKIPDAAGLKLAQSRRKQPRTGGNVIPICSELFYRFLYAENA